MNRQDAYSVCQQYLNQYVKVNTQNGVTFQGYIGKVDRDTVYVAIPEKGTTESDGARGGCYYRPRYPLSPGFYPPNYPPYYPAPYPYRRRGFRWIAIPLAFLAGVAVGSWFHH